MESGWIASLAPLQQHHLLEPMFVGVSPTECVVIPIFQIAGSMSVVTDPAGA